MTNKVLTKEDADAVLMDWANKSSEQKIKIDNDEVIDVDFYKPFNEELDRLYVELTKEQFLALFGYLYDHADELYNNLSKLNIKK